PLIPQAARDELLTWRAFGPSDSHGRPVFFSPLPTNSVILSGFREGSLLLFSPLRFKRSAAAFSAAAFAFALLHILALPLLLSKYVVILSEAKDLSRFCFCFCFLSAVGATQLSPTRKGGESAPINPSAVGATQSRPGICNSNVRNAPPRRFYPIPPKPPLLPIPPCPT